MERILIILILSLPSALNGSHSLWLLATYIQGETQFPKFSYTTILDDIIVGYYNSGGYIPRGNTTNEDDVIDSEYIKGVSDYMFSSFVRRSTLLRPNHNKSLGVYQTMVQCKLLDKDKPGQMISKDAASGSTTDELCYYNNSFTYNIVFNITSEVLKPHLEDFKKKFKTFYYPTCIETLMNYLKKRVDNVNRKMKPRLRLITKANTDSGGSQVSCLATGFYPRHINLTLFKDGQPVSDRKITGGDLLPNGDGTYQMRKTLEISAEEQREKHRYTCSATHSSLDNKLDVYLDNGRYRFWMVGCVVSVLVLVCIILAIRWRLQRC